MAAFIQPSFAKGELSPDLYGRVDIAAYAVGLRTARNLIIHTTGGASNRPGAIVVGPVKTHSIAPTLIPFQFRVSDQYMLEFGNLYMRVIRNDAHVVNTATNITAATQADPVVISASGHGFSNGDEIFITGVVGMTQLNGRRFIVAGVSGANFNLTDQVTSNNIDGRDYTAYSSAGTVASIFELTTPYATADLTTLKFVQSADVMTITHPTYDPRDLTRTDHNAWTLTVNTFAPSLAAPAGVTVAQQGSSGSTTHRYRVTAITQEEDVFEESLPGLDANVTLASATLANPIRCTATSHGYITGDEVEISAMDEMTALNGRRFFITRIDANTFDLDGEDGTDTAIYPTAETTGGIVNGTFTEITDSITEALTVLANFNRITWTAVTGANRYAIYRRESGRYGLVGEVDAPLVTFDDVTASVTTAGAIWKSDLSIGPPRARNPFLFANNFPAAVGSYEQRQVYGGTNNKPDTNEYSQTGNRLNMSVSTPVQADDAITATFTAREVNAIRHYVPGTDLIVLTQGGEWRVNASANSGFAADTLRQKPQSEWGSGHHRPIVAGEVIIFAEDDDATIRTLTFSLEPDKYIGEKLNLLASHLLAEDGPTTHTITDWAYAHSPEGRLHIVRSDGEALTMTFEPSQEVVAFTTWDTDGSYERVASLKKSISGAEDGVYWVIQRQHGDNTVRYIERTATRKFGDVRDAHFLDFGFILDTPFAISAVTVANPAVVTSAVHSLSNGDEVDIESITWVPTFDSNFNAVQPLQLNDRRYVVANITSTTFELAEDTGARITGVSLTDPVVVTAPSHGLSNGDVVWIAEVSGTTEVNDTLFHVNNVATDTFELQNVTTHAPINGGAFTAWTADGKIYKRVDGSAFSAYDTGGNVRATFTKISGLWEFEGQLADAVADGSVVEFATTAAGTVTAGDITLPSPASRAHVGRAYISDLEPLNIESARGTIQGALSKFNTVVVRFKKSRLPLIGPSKDDLLPMKPRVDEEMGSPAALFTGDREVTLQPSWNSTGRFFMRMVDPLPWTVTAIVPRIALEDTDEED